MPSKKSNPKIVLVQTRKSTKGGNKKKNKRRRSMSVPKDVADVLHVISDPCGGPLVTTLDSSTPGQVTERVRSTYSVAPSSETGNGYIVWFPSYHNDGYTVTNTSGTKANFAGNLFIYSNSSAGVSPSVTSSGAGTVAMSTTGLFMKDPANAMIASASPFSRAQAVSACLQMDYVGQLSALSGQVAVVSNYSLAAFIRNSGSTSTSGVPTFPTVDEVFAYANRRERVPLSGAEVIWRPSEFSSVMRNNGSFSDGSTISAPSVTMVDACFYAGNSSTATYPVAVDPNHVYGICIAWKGVSTSGASGLSFNCVKVATLELAPRTNQIEDIPRGLPAPKTAVTLNSALNYLDTEHTGWQQKLMNGVQSQVGMGTAGNAAGLAAAGGLYAASKNTAFRTLMTTITNGGSVFNARRSIMDSRA